MPPNTAQIVYPAEIVEYIGDSISLGCISKTQIWTKDRHALPNDVTVTPGYGLQISVLTEAHTGTYSCHAHTSNGLQFVGATKLFVAGRCNLIKKI